MNIKPYSRIEKVISYVMLFLTAMILSFPPSTAHSSSDKNVLAPAAACPPIQNTPAFTIAYGEFWWDGTSAPVDMAVEAVNPRGDLVGCFLVTSAGYYGTMYIYGEDTSVTPAIPGMRSNEIIRFRSNGQYLLSTPALVWNNDRTMHKIDLTNLTIDKSGSSLVLSWYGTNNSLNRYEVWRSSNLPYFTPGAANTTKLTDVNPPANPGILTFTDSSVLGNVDTNYFYLVRSVSTTSKNSDSNQAGEFEFFIYETTNTDYTWIGLVLNLPGVSKAKDLANHIQTHTNGTVAIKTISRWNASGQSISTYNHQNGFNNYSLSMMNPYRLEIDISGVSNGSLIWTQVGTLPVVAKDIYTLYETSGTDYTWILQPLDMTQVTNSLGLANDINTNSSAPLSVLTISRWNPSGQGFTSYNHQGGFGNFTTRFGYPYRVEVNVTTGSSVTWP